MPGKLEGKVALVTGGSRGVGRATGILFAKEGAKVVLMARGVEQLDVVAEEIKAAGGEASVFAGDVSKEEDCKGAVDLCMSAYGGLHVAFNNAGIYRAVPFVDTTEALLDEVLGTNVKSIVFGFKYQIPAMAKSGSKGSIVVCSSVMSQRGQSYFKHASLYSGSKANVDMLVKYGAIEAAEFGIRVNTVNPGIVDTPLWDAVPSDVLSGMCKDAQLFGRPVQPEEVSSMVVFLASDASSMITGSSHTIDGGWALKV